MYLKFCHCWRQFTYQRKLQWFTIEDIREYRTMRLKETTELTKRLSRLSNPKTLFWESSSLPHLLFPISLIISSRRKAGLTRKATVLTHRDGILHLPQSIQRKVLKALHDTCHFGKDSLHQLCRQPFTGKE